MANTGAIPISSGELPATENPRKAPNASILRFSASELDIRMQALAPSDNWLALPAVMVRSEEHTSELQSLMRITYAVFCLKKNTRVQYRNSIQTIGFN